MVELTSRSAGIQISTVGAYGLQTLVSRNTGVSTWLARAPVVECPPVVVKVAESGAGADAVRQELAALNALRPFPHPGLVQLRDQGVEHGLPWLAVDWSGSETLQERLTKLKTAGTKLEHKHILCIVRGLASALAHIHACGWLHGDLNPSNVIVVGEEHPVLIDFGAARSLESLHGLRRLAPDRGTATPGYIAPERLLGGTWDSRSDAYALGCIGFELLAGRPPFQAPDAEGLARQHVMRAVPSLHALVPDLDPALERVLSDLMAKDRHGRPSDLTDVVRELDRVLGAESIAPHRPRPSLFESRLFGRAEALSALERQIREACDERGGVTLLEGPRGVGRTRLLAQAMQEASRAGLDVVDLSNDIAEASTKHSVALPAALDSASPKLGCLIVVDDADDAPMVWARLVGTIDASNFRGRFLLLGAVCEHRLLATHAVTRILPITPLSRVASRRMVTDMLAHSVDEELQGLLWRDCLGNPAAVRRKLDELRTSAGLARGDEGQWQLTEEARGRLKDTARQPQESDWRRMLSSHRRTAGRAARTSPPDPTLVSSSLEAALTELRPHVHEGAKLKRVAIRIGYQLLKLMGRAADHNSVHALSQELVGWCQNQYPLFEAKIRRHNALSYRIRGENADATQQLELGLRCLERCSHTSKRVVERERFANRLSAAWTHYSDHDAEGTLDAVRSIASAVRRIGTPFQRSETLLHFAKAIALRRRFAFSDRVIELERRAFTICQHKLASPTARVSAQSNLAFMLLWGDVNHCQESVDLFENILAAARSTQDVTALTRVATYLAIGYRRLGRIDDCERQARATVELSHECGQWGYVAAATACLGWIALRRGKVTEAKASCGRATEIWQRRRAVDSSRRSEYPFQWLANLPLLAIAIAAGQTETCSTLIENLTHPTQARLAHPFDQQLRRAVVEGAAWNEEHWISWGELAVRTASSCRYM